MICSNCKTDNNDNAKYCKSCGSASIQTLPFMDRFPELNLRPASGFDPNIWFFHLRFDYIEDPYRDKKKQCYHLLVKNEKFGILYWKHNFLFDDVKILIKCKYDFIEKLEDRFKVHLNGKIFFIDLSGYILK